MSDGLVPVDFLYVPAYAELQIIDFSEDFITWFFCGVIPFRHFPDYKGRMCDPYGPYLN